MKLKKAQKIKELKALIKRLNKEIEMLEGRVTGMGIMARMNPKQTDAVSFALHLENIEVFVQSLAPPMGMNDKANIIRVINGELPLPQGEPIG